MQASSAVSAVLLGAHIKLDAINVFFMLNEVDFYGCGVMKVLTQLISHFSHCSITAEKVKQANDINYVPFLLRCISGPCQ